LLGCALVALLVCAACSKSSSNKSAASSGLGGAKGKTNVLFVLTDDMRLDDLQFMPHTRSLLGDQGATFDSYLDNVTLCCPARTSILRGQYSHNTGVLTNGGVNGGFETAHSKNLEQSTIATAMHDAGYTTGLFGKYLNGYPNGVDPSYVPPGWDQWASPSKGDAYGQFNYTLNQNGKQVDYGSSPDDYGTDVYVRLTKDFIHQAASQSKPFFAYLAVYAPHKPATPAPQDENSFPGLQAPRDPSFDEEDVSDKPQFIQSLPRISPMRAQTIDALYRRRVQSLQAVDRGVAALVDELRSDNALDNTVIMFASDNGFHLGQHRLPGGKETAYETDVHLPLLVRGPNIAAGSHVGAIAGNIDLAPTIAAIGGASMTDNPDGRSLAPLLLHPVDLPPDWRQAFLLEHWIEDDTGATPGGNAQLEPGDDDQTDTNESASSGGPPTSIRTSHAAGTRIPEYQGLRTATMTYVEYATGERELYDLVKDPYQLDNLASTADPNLLATLHARLESLRTCAADACRTYESTPLVLPR
jgi:arylsulfatase A-like enzyme